jgi:hypothetical protein
MELDVSALQTLPEEAAAETDLFPCSCTQTGTSSCDATMVDG